MKPYLLESDDNFLKYFTSGTFLGPIATKSVFFFRNKTKILRTHSKALHVHIQCHNTFQVTFQRPLNALFHAAHSLPESSHLPWKFHYLCFPLVTKKNGELKSKPAGYWKYAAGSSSLLTTWVENTLEHSTKTK